MTNLINYHQTSGIVDEKPETAEREFGNLLEIRDNFPKYVVTMDELNETSTYQGIQRNAREGFLPDDDSLNYTQAVRLFGKSM